MINLKKIALSTALILSVSALAGDWSDFKKFSGTYNIYGRELDDRIPPKVGDRKISIQLDRNISKDIFDSIGPDLTGPDVCKNDPKDRYREKGNIECMHTHDGGYSCSVGFDLTTGKSIVGSIC